MRERHGCGTTETDIPSTARAVCTSSSRRCSTSPTRRNRKNGRRQTTSSTRELLLLPSHPLEAVTNASSCPAGSAAWTLCRRTASLSGRGRKTSRTRCRRHAEKSICITCKKSYRAADDWACGGGTSTGERSRRYKGETLDRCRHAREELGHRDKVLLAERSKVE